MPEINFDTLVGPTHNFAGLSFGNLASMQSKERVSNPKLAAIQGLNKMYALHKFGIPQAIIAPHERPYFPLLQRLGFTGTLEQVLTQVWHECPGLLLAASSSSGMWTANALTTSPSSDSADGKVHFTPANLNSHLHRLPESAFVASYFKKVFASEKYFVHHEKLPSHLDFADEGAANHTRFCKDYESTGIQLFVYGRSKQSDADLSMLKFPARQTLQASQAITRLHLLKKDHYCFAKQTNFAINAGVFHNDVISVGNQHLFFYHEKAFDQSDFVIETLQRQLLSHCQTTLYPIKVLESEVSLAECVKTYLFNSQLITKKDKTMALLAPEECLKSKTVKPYLHELIKNPHCPIQSITYYPLNESMQNGGGPACLRLRVVLNDEEMRSMNSKVLFTDLLYLKLHQWIHTFYRDRLIAEDLKDPVFSHEIFTALDELTQILDLGSIYSFQKNISFTKE